MQVRMIPEPQRDALFAAWLEEHRGIMHRIGRSYARDASGLADLLQEMTVQLWASLPAFRAEAKPSTWIYRVCLNTALTWRRSAARRHATETPTDLARVACSAASPAERAAERELLEELYRAIHALPDFDRALVLLSLDAVPYREIAEITGVTENHVGVALTRARKRLAAHLKGVSDELE
jgi:RNA polymerase sigma-70 factor (ECF subfamily)